MLKLLFVTPKKENLFDLASSLAARGNVEVSWAESGEKALDMISDTSVDLMVADEELGDMTGLELASRLLRVNPMTNCAMVSALSAEEFHKVSEGLGLIAQLPIRPDAEHAEGLLNRLKRLKELGVDLNIGHKT
ncbi:MAG: response regulator [Desulfobacteraceae bacterium]|nr:response regulator [Desulfobacterales bacterium]MBL6967747.1 response regulator [Desulfobacteraceae bacterium]MBL7173633.1 response regulator [Desulfobacteraceae bacterium]